MKTRFKKTLAVVSAAAVVAASAAVMAVPASADDGTVAFGNVTMTLSELEAAGGVVEVPVTCDVEYHTVAFGYWLDEGVTLSDWTSGGVYIAKNGQFNWFTFSSAKSFSAGTIDIVSFNVVAEVGTYYITPQHEDYNGNDMSDLNASTDFTLVTGSITITEDAEETTTTTAAVATATTTTTTAAESSSSSTTTTTSSSPATGEALPIAGVCVAVAVIGSVALVSKKRK
ncbi:MAG: hypothetical protein LUF89_05845 [Ruminococcus sp.]|nr:hypothetical protein [Ruminococcus sp.]